MRAVADALLKWNGLGHFGATDVLIWWIDAARFEVKVALQGDAMRISKYVLDDGREMMRNVPAHGQRGGPGHLDTSLHHALGVDVGQTMSTPDEAYHEVLRGVGTAVAEALKLEEQATAANGKGYFGVSVTLMPKEGVPWVEGSKTTEYYSAKKRKTFTSTKPAWVVRGTYRDPDSGQDKEGLVADVCTLVAPVEARACGTAVIGELGGLRFFATHSFDLNRRGPAEESAANIARCGGLLYPSIAVGHLPASIYGTLSLFADVRMPLIDVKPYKTRGARYEVALYNTDTWTETTSYFLGTFARTLFLQLTGNDSEQVGFMAVLGPTLGGTGSPHRDGEKIKPVASTMQLKSLLAKRMKLWKEDVDQKQIVEDYRTSPERYPYLEAKVHAKVPLDCFPLAVAPIVYKEPALKFLRTAGYSGPLAFVDTTGIDMSSIAMGNMEATYRYSWRVREAVLALAAQNPKMIVDIIT